MTTDERTDRRMRAAQNQSLFREVNERLEGLAETFQFIAEHTAFTCECADTDCIAPMHLTLEEYEHVRAHPNRFAVLPGHVYMDVEDVLEDGDRFVVVAKRGAGAAVAKEEDPRTD